MIVVTRSGVSEHEIDRIRERIEQLGLRTHISRGEHRTIIGVIGDETKLRAAPLQAIVGVEIFNPKTGEWEKRPGPVVRANILLLDEGNRISPKSQSAFLARESPEASGGMRGLLLVS